MWKWIKSYYNKNYAIVCAYIIGTAVTIFALAWIVMNINHIISWINGFVKYILGLLTPVIIGVIIAYLLDPLAQTFADWLKKVKFIHFKKPGRYRTVGVIASLVFIMLLILGLITAFIFSITKQISSSGLDELVTLIANYIKGFTDSLENVDQLLKQLNIDSIAINNYIEKISVALVTGLSNFADGLVNSTMSFSGVITDALIGIIIALYLMLDKDSFIGYGNTFARAMFKDTTTTKIKNGFHDFDTIFSGYIRGQMADVVFMCIALSLTLSVIGIKFGILIGCFAGLCNIIPYFGPIVAYAGTISFGMLNGQFKQVIIAVICLIIIQQIDGSYVGPKLMGQNVALKPIFILIAVSIGGAAFGLWGMILAVPVAGLIRLILARTIETRLEEKAKELDYDIETNPEVSD